MIVTLGRLNASVNYYVVLKLNELIVGNNRHVFEMFFTLMYVMILAITLQLVKLKLEDKCE
jgi:hypothetical protein